jgi:hypothetical protein
MNDWISELVLFMRFERREGDDPTFSLMNGFSILDVVIVG